MLGIKLVPLRMLQCLCSSISSSIRPLVDPSALLPAVTGGSSSRCFPLGWSHLQGGVSDSALNSSRSAAVKSRSIASNHWRRPYTQQLNSGGANMVAVRDLMELTEMEEQIFAILKGTLKHFGLKTQLRVAGGWVRDKLLGGNTKDIDIAIDDMLGRVFCDKVNEYLLTLGEEIHTVGVIQSNPDQSKHLETANMRILGLSIDFVNLRAETYTETSRIPEMEFGTPEEDALRRDLTINSLFYNLNSGMVEDFTKRGIPDLKEGIICTPLPPEATFLDDPLRVCRAIRFGARLDFKMDAELLKAASSETVKIALETKVSKERIGHEIELMLMGNQPVKAMRSVEELQLFPLVFRVPKDVDPEFSIPENYGRFCVEALQAATMLLRELKTTSELSKDLLRLVLFGALFLPLHEYACFPDNKKKKKVSVSTYIIRESLKLRANDASGVEELYSAAIKFKSLTKRLLQTDLECAKDVKSPSHANIGAFEKHRVDLGLVLVKIKERWQGALLLSMIMEPQFMIHQEGAVFSDESSIKEKAETCKFVEDVVIGLGLTQVWESKPLLDGKEIMAALNLGKGKQVQEWKDRVLEWQLAHPHRTAEECHEWICEENVKRLKSN